MIQNQFLSPLLIAVMSALQAATTQLWRHVCLAASLLILARFDSPAGGGGALAAPFSSWAGKRSGPPMAPSAAGGQPGNHRADLAQILHDLRELYMLENYEDAENEPQPQPRYPAVEDYYPAAQKRAPFSSWAGKKKRAPFSSWAGKRKRAPFSSWAGKRSAPIEDEEENETEEGAARRMKRSSEEDEELLAGGAAQELGRQRRGANSFSAWGGKRTALLRRFTRDVHSDSGIVPVKVLRPHRAAFSAWGG